MEHLPVMLRLNVGQVNRLLSLLGTHAYNAVSDLISDIKGQGDAQIAAAQAAQLGVSQPVADKPNPMPPKTDEPSKVVASNVN